MDTLLRVGLALFLVGACDEQKAGPGSSEEHNGKTSTPAKTTEVTKAESVEAPESETNAEAGAASSSDSADSASLLDYDSKGVSAQAAESSRKLNAEALALHNDKNYVMAAAKYAAAIAANPGNVVARYNLSCAYNMAGMTDQGLEVLAQLQNKDCRACLAQLVWAKKDSEWASARKNPRFVELTKGVVVKSPTIKQAAKRLMQAFAKRSVDPIDDIIHPDHRVAYVEIDNDGCDSENDAECRSTKKLYGKKEVAAEIMALTKPVDFDDPDLDETGYNPPDRLGQCSDDCCAYEVDGMGHGVHWLMKACFRTRDDIVWLSEFHISNEGIR